MKLSTSICPPVCHVVNHCPRRIHPSRRHRSQTDVDSDRLVPAARRTVACDSPERHGLLPSGPQTSSAHASAQRQFLSSASRLGRDRRDADHGRARGRGAVRIRRADRAHLSAGAHRKAARSRHRRDRGRAGHRALHHARQRAGRAAAEQMPRVQPSRACRSSIRCWACSSPISARNRPGVPAPSTRSMPSISSASMR